MVLDSIKEVEKRDWWKCVHSKATIRICWQGASTMPCIEECKFLGQQINNGGAVIGLSEHAKRNRGVDALGLSSQHETVHHFGAGHVDGLWVAIDLKDLRVEIVRRVSGAELRCILGDECTARCEIIWYKAVKLSAVKASNFRICFLQPAASLKNGVNREHQRSLRRSF